MPRESRSWGLSFPDVVHDGKGVTYRLHADGASHDRADVERLGDFGFGRAQVEDLLHAVLDSVEAALHDGHRERRQLLVPLAERTVGEHALADLSHRARYLHGALGDQTIQSLPLLVLLVQVYHALSFVGSSMRIRARASASPRRARSRRTMLCCTSAASCAVGSAIHARAQSRFSPLRPSVGDSLSRRRRRSSASMPAARSRPTTAPRTPAFHMPVSASMRAA